MEHGAGLVMLVVLALGKQETPKEGHDVTQPCAQTSAIGGAAQREAACYARPSGCNKEKWWWGVALSIHNPIHDTRSNTSRGSRDVRQTLPMMLFTDVDMQSIYTTWQSLAHRPMMALSDERHISENGGPLSGLRSLWLRINGPKSTRFKNPVVISWRINSMLPMSECIPP